MSIGLKKEFNSFKMFGLEYDDDDEEEEEEEDDDDVTKMMIERIILLVATLRAMFVNILRDLLIFSSIK